MRRARLPPGERLDAVAFAERLLALLDTGCFTATSKFAVLLAIVDCCLEQCGPDGQPPRTLRAWDVAAKLLERYWSQAVPYTGEAPRPSSVSGDLITKIAQFRQGLPAGTTLPQARALAADDLAELEREVYVTVVRMPLPKLQRVARDDRPFITRSGGPTRCPGGECWHRGSTTGCPCWTRSASILSVPRASCDR